MLKTKKKKKKSEKENAHPTSRLQGWLVRNHQTTHHQFDWLTRKTTKLPFDPISTSSLVQCKRLHQMMIDVDIYPSA